MMTPSDSPCSCQVYLKSAVPNGRGRCLVCGEPYDPARRVVGAAPAAPASCDVCPHVDYLTVNVDTSAHVCDSCGATFIDARRPKRYFGRAPR